LIEPHDVKSGVVHLEMGSREAAGCVSQMRTSPSRLAAARRRPSGLKAQLNTGGPCENAATRSPVMVSCTVTDGSVSGAGSYFHPPGKYWPVHDATRRPSGDTANCQLQNRCAVICRQERPVATSCHSKRPS